MGAHVVVPINILNPNPINSGGLGDATIGINYDKSVFSVANISTGTVNTPAGWGINANNNNPGQIIITTAAISGALPIKTTAPGSLALITFNVIGLPSAGLTSVVNLSAVNPQATNLDFAGIGIPVTLPLAVAPIDNTNFNGLPGSIDGLVTFNPIASTTLTVGATAGGASVSTVTYGTPVTLTATVASVGGAGTPSAGSVDFKDGSIDLGLVSTETGAGNNAVFTLVTLANQLQVNGGSHTITAVYNPGTGFGPSTGTLAGGLTVTRAALTITAVANTKIYDATISAVTKPTVSGLVVGDTISGLAEVYTGPNAGSTKTLSVSAYTLADGNGGNNYTVTTVSNTTGVINKAPLTLTARTNAKTYDATASAGATPTVAGLVGGDTVTNLTEVYVNANAGLNKTLGVSAYTVVDGNNGNNYAVATVASTTGVINRAFLTISALANTKTYDSTTSSAVAPTVSGLLGSDSVSSLTETYNNVNAGNGKFLFVNSYTINDGNSGGNYTVSTVANSLGSITKATLTITALANTKTYDATSAAAAIPVVSGLIASDTLIGQKEVYIDKNAGSGKLLSVSAYTINDGNSGNNYSVTTVTEYDGIGHGGALNYHSDDKQKDL